jgi:hypothetical protein
LGQQVRGFGARIFGPAKWSPSGARSFFVDYRIGGREKPVHDRFPSRAERRGGSREGQGAAGMKRNVEYGHERFFSGAERAAISDALNGYGKTAAANCIRFIMLIGCRRGERCRPNGTNSPERGRGSRRPRTPKFGVPIAFHLSRRPLS